MTIKRQLGPEEMKLVKHLGKQLPEAYSSGVFYPAKDSRGNEWEIKRTYGKGKNKGAFLHLRRKVENRVVDPDGKVTIMKTPAYLHYRANMSVYPWEVTRVD